MNSSGAMRLQPVRDGDWALSTWDASGDGSLGRSGNGTVGQSGSSRRPKYALRR